MIENLATIIKQYRDQIEFFGHQHDYEKISQKDTWIFGNICLVFQKLTNTQVLIDEDAYPYFYSFVSMWFFQENGLFLAKDKGNQISYTGLIVLVHRHLPFYTVMIGTKTWDKNNTDIITNNYQLSVNKTDKIYHSQIQKLIPILEKIFDKYHFTRLHYQDLNQRWYEPLPADEMLEFQKKPTYFDTLFYQYLYNY